MGQNVNGVFVDFLPPCTRVRFNVCRKPSFPCRNNTPKPLYHKALAFPSNPMAPSHKNHTKNTLYTNCLHFQPNFGDYFKIHPVFQHPTHSPYWFVRHLRRCVCTVQFNAFAHCSHRNLVGAIHESPVLFARTFPGEHSSPLRLGGSPCDVCIYLVGANCVRPPRRFFITLTHDITGTLCPTPHQSPLRQLLLKGKP